MPLTPPQIEAAQLIFTEELDLNTIAETIGIDSRTLRRWKELPEFVEEIKGLHKELAKCARNRILSTREARLSEKMDRHSTLKRIIRKRAAEADPKVPGADSGLMIKRVYTTKDGTYEEYRIDHVTLRELSRLEDQIAKDLGQDKTPPEEIKEEPIENIDFLTNDEVEVMIMIHNRVAEHNDTKGPYYRELQQYELESGARKMQTILDNGRKFAALTLKTT